MLKFETPVSNHRGFLFEQWDENKKIKAQMISHLSFL